MKKIILLFAFVLTFANANAQFTEGFDSGIPASWTVINGGDTNTWVQLTTPATFIRTGTGVASITYSATAHDDFLITPAITVVAGVNDRFSFWARSFDPSFPEEFDLKISTTTATAAAFTTTLANIAPDSNLTVWTQYTYNLTAYVGQTIYIGMHSTTTDMWRITVDDVTNDGIPSIAPSCAANPLATPDAACGNSPTALSWDATSGADGYYLTVGTAPGGTDVLNNVNIGLVTTYSLATQIAGTLYYWKVVPFNAAGSATGCSEQSYTTNALFCYCSSITYTSAVEPITLVNFAGINNVTDATVDGTPDLEDFTSMVANVNTGTTYPITLKGNSGGNFTNRYIVFIDWNQNGTLNDAGEVYFSGTTDMNTVNSTGVDAIQAVGNILVPATATLGNTRMRVKKIFGTTNFIDPCLGAGYGQVEDYTVNVAALSNNTFNDINFSSYPNPVKDVLNLSYDKEITSVVVYNLLGQEVMQKSINATQYQIEMSNLNTGTYIVKVSADNQVKTIKVIKQ